MNPMVQSYSFVESAPRSAAPLSYQRAISPFREVFLQIRASPQWVELRLLSPAAK